MFNKICDFLIQRKQQKIDYKGKRMLAYLREEQQLLEKTHEIFSF